MIFHEGTMHQANQEDHKKLNLTFLQDQVKGYKPGNMPEKPKTLQSVAIEYELSGEELMLCSHYLVAMKAKSKGINPHDLMNIINNWDDISKAIEALTKFNAK